MSGVDPNRKLPIITSNNNAYNQTNAANTTKNSSNESSNINAESWLNLQTKSRLANLNAIRDLINSVYNTALAHRPNNASIFKLIDAKFAKAFPVSREILSNPNSKQFREIKPLVDDAVTELANSGIDIQVLYSSQISNIEMANSKKVVILQLDLHDDVNIRRRNFMFQKKLYESEQIPMSSSLVEGGGDPSGILSQIPPGMSAANLMAQGVSPESIIQHESKQKSINSLNSGFVKHTAESITETEGIRNLLPSLITIGAGVNHIFFPSDHVQGANHTLGMLTRKFIEVDQMNLSSDFLIAFSLQLEKELDRLSVNSDLKKRLFASSVEVFLNHLRSTANRDPVAWDMFYQRLAVQITNIEDDTALRDYYKQTRYEYLLAERNQKIVQTISSSDIGTRAMIIGQSHLDDFFAKDQKLIKLFEESKIPVIVIGKKNQNIKL